MIGMLSTCAKNLLPQSHLRALAAALAVLMLAPAGDAFGQNFTTIKRFNGGANGAGPVGRLAQGSGGWLYGTTQQGGTFGQGTVFRLARVGNVWQHQVIYNFGGGSDGSFPQGGLIVTANGVLYGTTTSGGVQTAICESGCGTVFRLVPNANFTEWTQTIIHRFAGGSSGREPRSGVIFNNNRLYGTTYGAGNNGFGTVYRLIPSQNFTVWTKSVLHHFTGGLGGGNPEADVTFFEGNLYGLATREGIKTGQCSQNSQGCGTFFRLTPTASGNAPWPHAVLYRFQGTNDGMEPSGPLSLFNGAFTGTTHRGGTANKGTVFRLVRNASNVWTESVIYNFQAGTDGRDPQGVIRREGIIHGVTTTDGSANQGGIVYRLELIGQTWTRTVLKRFTGGLDGESPQGRLLLNPNSGILYGVTFGGGNASESGTVFEMFRPQ